MRLPDELKARLDALSASTGRSAAYYVREALVEHLDELEYAYQLKAEAEAARRGEMSGPTWEKLMEEVGLTEAAGRWLSGDHRHPPGRAHADRT